MAPSFNLPGFYFDEVKNRYFPLSGKPKPGASEHSHIEPRHDAQNALNKRRRRKSLLTAELQVSSTFAGRCRRRVLQDIMDESILRTSSYDSGIILMHGSRITTFLVSPNSNSDPDSDGNGTRCFVGDNHGWIYSHTSFANRRKGYYRGTVRASLMNSGWTPEFNLASSLETSEVSSICISGNRCVATSFGPACKILAMNGLSPDSDSFVIVPGGQIHEIWTSDLHESRLVMGANEMAVILYDIDIPTSRALKTGSDIFSIYQQQNLVYTGARNGSITRFDLRDHASQPLFGASSPIAGRSGSSRSSITHLDVVREWQLLTSQMNGRLESFDLRFLRGGKNTLPLLEFPGHVNSLTLRLGIAVDPLENHVFAAGADGRIRVWSLQSGRPLHPRGLPEGNGNPFMSVYDKPVSALQKRRRVLYAMTSAPVVLPPSHPSARHSLLDFIDADFACQIACLRPIVYTHTLHSTRRLRRRGLHRRITYDRHIAVQCRPAAMASLPSTPPSRRRPSIPKLHLKSAVSVYQRSQPTSPDSSITFDYPIIPVPDNALVPSASEYLLDDDPFAKLDSPSCSTPTVAAAAAVVQLDSATSCVGPKSPLSSPPRTSVASTFGGTIPSPPKTPPAASSIQRTMSSRSVRYAYQKPAFKPRPSLPSLHALSKMNLPVPVKVRKGHVGARLPSEPWNLVFNDPSSSSEGGCSDSHSPITDPAFFTTAEPEDEDYGKHVQTSSPEEYVSPFEMDYHHDEDLHHQTLPIEQPGPDDDASTRLLPPIFTDWDLSLECNSSSAADTPSMVFSSPGSDVSHHDISSFPFPPEFPSATTAAAEQSVEDLGNSPPSECLFGDANASTSVETVRSPISQMSLCTSPLLDLEISHHVNTSTSAETFRSPVSHSSLSSSPQQHLEISPPLFGHANASTSVETVRSPMSQYSPRRCNSEVTDSSGNHGRYGSTSQSYHGYEGSSWNSASQYSRRTEGGGGGMQGAGGTSGGGGGGGSGRGDDEGDKPRRQNPSSFLDDDSESEHESEDESDYGQDEFSAPQQPGESSSSDDDVPLAQQIPTALTAQRTIRKQVREEKDQKRRDKVLRQQQQQQYRVTSVVQASQPLRMHQEPISPRARQTTLRPAGAQAPISQLGALSSSQEAAIIALRRPRTQTLPSRAPQPFNPDELTRRLAGANAHVQDYSPFHTPSRKGLEDVDYSRPSSSNPRTSTSRSRAASPDHHVAVSHPPPLPVPSHSPPAPVKAVGRARSMRRLDAAARAQFLEECSRAAAAPPVPPPPPPPVPTAQDIHTPVHQRPRSNTTSSRSKSKVRTSLDRGTHDDGFDPRHSRPPPLPLEHPAPPADKVHLVRQQIYIGNADIYHTVDISPTMNAKDVTLYMEDQGYLKGWVGSGDWMLWECCQDFGMERPIRTFELVVDVMASWNRDKTVGNNKFMMKLTHLAPLLSRSVLPSSPPTLSGYVEWEVKPGKWNKRFLALRESNLYLAKREHVKEEFLCSVSNFDAYLVTRVVKAPKEFTFALKSTDNLSFFEDKADYLHMFSSSEQGGRKWLETILLARSYLLYQERTATFTTSANGALPAGLGRAKSTKRPVPPRPSVGGGGSSQVASSRPSPSGLPPPRSNQPVIDAGVFAPGSLLSKQV